MVAPTWCHGANWGNPFSGWVMTVRTTEFTNFKLVIHLSKLQQPAILFFQPFEIVPLILWSQGFLADAFLQLCSRFWITRNLRFLQQLLQRHIALSHDLWSGRHTTFRCGILSFWFSGEVKHIVHLIRWNLKAVLCHCGTTWPRSPVQGIIARLFRHLGTESCFPVLFFTN